MDFKHLRIFITMVGDLYDHRRGGTLKKEKFAIHLNVNQFKRLRDFLSDLELEVLTEESKNAKN